MKMLKVTGMFGKVLLLVLLLLLVTFLGGMAGCNKTDGILEVPPEEEYSYINPDETKAETDAGLPGSASTPVNKKRSVIPTE